jgi:hypothetical protein
MPAANAATLQANDMPPKKNIMKAGMFISSSSLLFEVVSAGHYHSHESPKSNAS